MCAYVYKRLKDECEFNRRSSRIAVCCVGKIRCMGGATGECGGQNHILQVMTVAVSFFSVNYVVFERKPHKVLHLINAEPFAVVCTKMFCKEQICVK